jgi:hypothetical protein
MTTPSPADQGAAIAERRQVRRHRALLNAQIIFRNGFCSMGGQILNVSDTGALVKPADAVTCPAKFLLQPRFAAPRHCEVVWRKGETLGVRYSS